jgi:anionic cell wall polymer biosynthesis LytR-Cps2A-Psr (LCP) family protein
MGLPKARFLTTGKIGYAAACLVAATVLVVGGYAHGLTGSIDNLQGGANLGGDVPSTGAMNILLMGLESRTNFEGQTLSAAELAETHAGSLDGTLGAQDTDTLILIHVFAGGTKAVGYSIPRDDIVNYPYALDGITEGKIDGAYDAAYNAYVSANIGKTGNTAALYNGANKAGQLYETQTVESVTGVHVDHFVVSNIYGFYSISKDIGGLNVCIAPAPASIEPAGEGFVTGANLVDLPYEGANFALQSNSGFDAYNDGYSAKKGGAQYLHLSPAQSLAFVRARDSVPGVDIGRTKRQQAAIDYIIYDFKHRSILSDPGTISTLLSQSSSFLEVDQGFDLLDFAPKMQALTGQNLKLSTLPDAAVTGITIPGLGSDQDGNYIYVPNIQQTVNHAFYGSAAIKAAKSVNVSVYNGSGTPGLAAAAAQSFAAMGYTSTTTGNANQQSQPLQDETQVFYGTGAENNADSIAATVGEYSGPVSLSSLPAGQVEVLLGSQVTNLPPGLENFAADTVTAQDFITAAQQNNLPASEMPPANGSGATSADTAGAGAGGAGAGTGGGAGTADAAGGVGAGGTTESVSAAEVGSHAAAVAGPAATARSAATSSASAALSALSASASASTSSAPAAPDTYTGPRPADVPAGIPCVY